MLSPSSFYALRACLIALGLAAMPSAVLAGQLTGYLSFTPVSISLTVKRIDVQSYSLNEEATSLKSRIVTSRFSNRDILELLGAAGLLIGKDGKPTTDIRGWSLVAGVGFNATPWPKLQGIGCYAVNRNILQPSKWNGADLYVPGLSLFGGLNGTPANPTLAKIQINGVVPLTSSDLRGEPGGNTTIIEGRASFEGPVEIAVVLPNIDAPTDPTKTRSFELQGHIQGGFTGFNWYPDAGKTQPRKNSLPLRQTTVSGLSGVFYNPPDEESGVSVPSILSGSMRIGPTRMIPYTYDP